MDFVVFNVDELPQRISNILW